MSKRKILVVEDDPAVREGVVDALEFDGYAVHEAANFQDAVRFGVSGDFDLVLLDLVLPGGDGLDVLKQVRTARPTVPVVILSARGQENDRVTGLKLGADDYVLKPFSVRELLARVEAVLRRSAERPTDRVEVALPSGVADLACLELRFEDGSRFELSEREGTLLRYLAVNAGRVVSRDELLEKVWHIPSGNVRTRTVDMHIARLRDKIRDTRPEPTLIRTVRGRGYIFEARK